MRNFPIDCEVIFTRPNDNYNGKIGKIADVRSHSGHYMVDVDNARIMRHENDICEASEFMKEKAMQNEIELIPEPDLSDVAKGIWVCIDKGYDFENTKEYFYGQKVDEELLINLYDECKDEGISAFAKKYMSGKTMQDELIETKTPEVVENPKINTPVIVDLESEAKTTLPVIIFDKQRYIDAIDAMPLEEITSKWLKQIKDEAIAIDKKICAPVKAWRLEVDEIIEYAEKRIAKLKADAAAAEEKRRAAKKIEVDKLIADAKARSDLPPEYLAKIVFKPEYYQVGFKGNKLLEDLQAQFDLQKSLKKGVDDALALQQANIKNRELLLQNLNQQYGFNGVYSQFTIELYPDDEQVKLIYKSKKEKQDAEEAQKQAAAEAQNTNASSQNVHDEAAGSSSQRGNQGVQNLTPKSQNDLQRDSQNRTGTTRIYSEAHNHEAVHGQTGQSAVTDAVLTKTFTITIDAGSAERSAGAMATIEKRLAEMRDNFATKYGVKMEICQQ